MGINRSMMSSAKSEWETPWLFFAPLNREFQFELDVCADLLTAKCDRYYTKEDDAFTKPWKGRCWMNPPYGRAIGRWVQKAYDESEKDGCMAVCLVPARTDTRWWGIFWDHENHRPRRGQDQVRFVRGRITFGINGDFMSPDPAPFPSAIVVMRGGLLPD